MPLFDGHCDTILKLLENTTTDFSFSEARGGFIQTFAYYSEEKSPEKCINAINYFKNYIKDVTDFEIIYTNKQFHRIIRTGGCGAFLALENCGCLENDICSLLTLYNLGIRSIALTWNYENAFASGCSCNYGGLTDKGKDLILLAEKLGILIDLSHLNSKSFYDVINFGHGKVYCSHSSCHALCPHPRNLTDKQIKTLFEAGGIMCVCPNPLFLTGTKTASVSDFALHLKHAMNLTSGRGVAIGTDTDGTEFTALNLKTTADLLSLPGKLEAFGFNKFDIQNIFSFNFDAFL